MPTNPSLTTGAPAGTRAAPDTFDRCAVWLVALVVLYRPLVAGSVHNLASTSAFGFLLCVAAFLWLCGQARSGLLRIRLGTVAAVFGLLMASCLLSAVHAENWFAGLRWCWTLATYGLTAFMVIQTAQRPAVRRFYVACFLATGAAAAAYGLWHYAVDLPALRRLYGQEGETLRIMMGAGEGFAEDLRARVLARRAFGSFVTPNQFADFLLLVLFPTGALLVAQGMQGRERAARAGRWVLAAMLALIAVALYLSGSKGGWLTALIVLPLFAAGPARRLVVSRPRRTMVVVAVGVVIVVLAWLAGLLPERERFAASLRVRQQYWHTTVGMALQRPVFGVGPGSWSEWYAILKAPEFEETRNAHSAYLQVWAETGTVGLLSFLLLWAVVLIPAGRRVLAGRPPPEDASPPGDVRAHTIAGVWLAALALGFDWAVLKTFCPVWGGGIAAAAPYLLIFAVWVAAFLAIHRAVLPRAEPAVAGGALVALAAFLVHSGAEFTLVVPALGGSAALLAGVLLAQSCPPRPIELRLTGAARGALVIAGASAVLLLGLAVRRAVDCVVHLRAAEHARIALALPDRGRPRPEEVRQHSAALIEHHQRACEAVPWDDGLWRELAGSLLVLADSGLAPDAAEVAATVMARAQQLNPLNAANWARQGRAYAVMGDMAAAAHAYLQAADLHPTLPTAWYRYAATAEAAGLHQEEWADAYRWARGLIGRQYHRRNRILGPPWAAVAAWAELARRPVESVLLDMWREPWDAGRRQQPWDRLSDAQKKHFVLGDAEVDAEGLWRAAGARGRWQLLLEVATRLNDSGPTPADAATALRHLGSTVAECRRLAEQWEAWTDAEREQALWDALAEWLWLRIVEAKVKQGGQAAH